MALTDRRYVLRSLPALLALLVALLSAPQATSAAAGPGARPLTRSALVLADAPATTTSEASSTHDDEPDTAVADTTRVLSTQRVAGPAGSRAPPAAR